MKWKYIFRVSDILFKTEILFLKINITYINNIKKFFLKYLYI